MGHECPECTFVASREDIYVDPRLIKKATTRPIFLGNFTMPGFTGHVRFYLLKCRFCGAVLIDNAKGYTDLYWLFFTCFECGYEGHPAIIKIKDREIYKAEGMPMPPQGRSRSTIVLLLLGIIAMILLVYRLANS